MPSGQGAFDYNAQIPAVADLPVRPRDERNLAGDQRTGQRDAARCSRPTARTSSTRRGYETKTALRVRNLESNQERWLINNVTRDDQESRATRDTFPGYDFMPDGKSLIVPIDGKIKRVDFATGQATDIPFTVNVEAEIGPRVHFELQGRRFARPSRPGLSATRRSRPTANASRSRPSTSFT